MISSFETFFSDPFFPLLNKLKNSFLFQIIKYFIKDQILNCFCNQSTISPGLESGVQNTIAHNLNVKANKLKTTMGIIIVINILVSVFYLI